jgi:hypothetical protein
MLSPTRRITNCFGKRKVMVALSSLFLICFLISSGPALWAAPEKPSKKPGPPPTVSQKNSSINDSNVQTYLKRADEMMRKGEVDSPLKILLGVYDYSKDVLVTLKYFQTHYEKAVNDSSTSQGDKEEIYVKLKRIAPLVPKYNSIREATTYNIGYLYAKKGDAEKARKYLTEVLDLTPFSLKKDSISMRAKTLLLELYDLEGEF